MSTKIEYLTRSILQLTIVRKKSNPSCCSKSKMETFYEHWPHERHTGKWPEMDTNHTGQQFENLMEINTQEGTNMNEKEESMVVAERESTESSMAAAERESTESSMAAAERESTESSMAAAERESTESSMIVAESESTDSSIHIAKSESTELPMIVATPCHEIVNTINVFEDSKSPLCETTQYMCDAESSPIELLVQFDYDVYVNQKASSISVLSSLEGIIMRNIAKAMGVFDCEASFTRTRLRRLQNFSSEQKSSFQGVSLEPRDEVVIRSDRCTNEIHQRLALESECFSMEGSLTVFLRQIEGDNTALPIISKEEKESYQKAINDYIKFSMEDNQYIFPGYVEQVTYVGDRTNTFSSVLAGQTTKELSEGLSGTITTAILVGSLILILFVVSLSIFLIRRRKKLFKTNDVDGLDLKEKMKTDDYDTENGDEDREEKAQNRKFPICSKETTKFPSCSKETMHEALANIDSLSSNAKRYTEFISGIDTGHVRSSDATQPDCGEADNGKLNRKLIMEDSSSVCLSTEGDVLSFDESSTVTPRRMLQMA